MKRAGNRRFLSVVMVAGLAALMFQACSPAARTLDEREGRDPLVRRARAKEKARDIDAAIELYNKALDNKPRLARAHLELGLLYDKHREDYMRAIFHYERYIQLRPNAEKRELIQRLIDQGRIAYAASLPDRPSAAIDEIARLKREVKRLTEELARQSEVGAPPRTTAPAASSRKARTTVPPRSPRPAPAQPPMDTYRVQRGDTLSSIAAKMYNDAGKWHRIYEANRDKLTSPESLRMGQTLIIPGA